MSDGKVFKIDKKEYVKQMKESMTKEEHIKLEIIVAKGSMNPICEMNVDGAGAKEVGLMYLALEEIRSFIKEEYPTAIRYAEEHLKLQGNKKLNLDD